MPLRIFITGSTGYVGRAIADRLVRAGLEVHGLTRDADRAKALATAGIRPVIGNLADPESYLADLKNCDAVVHAAVDHEARTTHDQLALEAIRAAAQDGRVRRLLYTSGCWDYGATGSQAADEGAPLQPITLVKWRPAHHEVAFDLAECEVVVSVMVPAIVYGETRGILGEWWAEARERHTVTYPGNGAQHWALVHRDDVAAAYALALEHGKAGERYLLADESQFTVKELAAAVARATGATPQSWPADQVQAKLGDYAEALLLDQRISAGKARRELGWVPRHTSFVNEADDLYREWQSGLSAPVA